MEERAEGIILRTRPLTETSLIVEWLTADAGRLATVAKGARRPKSPFAGKLDLFYEAAFSFQRSVRSELHALREVQVKKTHSHLRSSLPLLHQAAYFTVLLEKGTERETPLPELYALLQGYVARAPDERCLPEVMFLFEQQYLRILGFDPQIGHPHFDLDFALVAPLPREERNQLNRALRTAVGEALGQVPAQRQRAIEAMLAR